MTFKKHDWPVFVEIKRRIRENCSVDREYILYYSFCSQRTLLFVNDHAYIARYKYFFHFLIVVMKILLMVCVNVVKNEKILFLLKKQKISKTN